MCVNEWGEGGRRIDVHKLCSSHVGPWRPHITISLGANDHNKKEDVNSLYSDIEIPL